MSSETFGIYHDGMHVRSNLEERKVIVSANFGQIVLTVEQAAKLSRLLDHALSEFNNYTFGIGYEDGTR